MLVPRKVWEQELSPAAKKMLSLDDKIKEPRILASNMPDDVKYLAYMEAVMQHMKFQAAHKNEVPVVKLMDTQTVVPPASVAPVVPTIPVQPPSQPAAPHQTPSPQQPSTSGIPQKTSRSQQRGRRRSSDSWDPNYVSSNADGRRASNRLARNPAWMGKPYSAAGKKK